MKKMKLTVVAILALVIIGLSSCEKETSAPSATKFKPTFEKKGKLNSNDNLKANSNSDAQTTFDEAKEVKDNIESYAASFEIPEEAKLVDFEGKNGNWSWKNSGYDVTYSLKETDTKYEFEFEYKAADGTVYTSIKGWETLDQKTGNYTLSNSGVDIIMEWKETSEGYDVIQDVTTGSVTIRHKLTSNTDGSGSVSQSVSTSTSEVANSAEWNADGSGSRKIYIAGVVTVTEEF